MLDLKAQYGPLRDEIVAAMTEVVEAQWFIMGPNVKELETQVAEYCHAKHAIGCASGSDALLLALMGIGIEPGDEVICPSYTFFATAGSIHRLGAKPVFVDINPTTYNMDLELVREAASRCSRLKAIIPVHLFGQSVDMTAYNQLGADLGVPVIEDAAQAIGSIDNNGIRAGSTGTVGCFSFFPSKNLGGFGDGGIMTTNDDVLAERLGILRLHGGKPKYYHHVVGINSRLDALQAVILSIKLKHLDDWHAARLRNAERYNNMFEAAGSKTSSTPLSEGGFPLRTPEGVSEPGRHIYNQYCIRVPEAIRNQLRDHLKDQGVGTEIYYPVPLHEQACFESLGYKLGDLPESESAARETIALPIYPELTEEQQNHVASTICKFVEQHAPAKV